MTPKGEYVSMFAGIIVATAASFAVAALILKTSKDVDSDESLELASAKMKDMKNESKGVHVSNSTISSTAATTEKLDVKKIVFACDAGMGSSAMGASLFRKKVKQAGLPITVINTAISDLPADADIVITHASLTDRARAKLPQAEHISINDFIQSPEYEKLINRLT
jgi:PTS system mannitol-specific IIC component